MIEIHVYKHFAADTLLSGPFLIPEKWTDNPRLIVVLVASSGSLLVGLYKMKCYPFDVLECVCSTLLQKDIFLSTSELHHEQL
jgi:hypothetical protein